MHIEFWWGSLLKHVSLEDLSRREKDSRQIGFEIETGSSCLSKWEFSVTRYQLVTYNVRLVIRNASYDCQIVNGTLVRTGEQRSCCSDYDYVRWVMVWPLIGALAVLNIIFASQFLHANSMTTSWNHPEPLQFIFHKFPVNLTYSV
jgi:hypothetical protein